MATSLRSMTGFGRATRAAAALSAQAEARSVNGRYLSVRFRLPGDLARLEPKLEALVKGRVARGTVDVSVRLERDRAQSLPRIDRRVLEVYRREAEALGRSARSAGRGRAGARAAAPPPAAAVDPASLLALPGVVSFGEKDLPEGAVDRLVLDAAGQAIAALDRARAAEGRRLAAALRRELGALARHVAALRRLVPEAVRARQEALGRRVADLLGGALAPDDPGLRRELALLADKADITEELDRLDSHLAALREALAAGEPVGRHVDFLLQEVGREVNTTGAKSGDARLVARVVLMKGCVERLREQAANIE